MRSLYSININGMTGKSQDKFTTEKGLKVMVERLVKISEGVCDGSSSGAKSFREIVQVSEKHQTASNQKDIWHRQTKVLKKWSKWITKPEAAELKEKLKGRKLYKWYYTCALDCGGDPEVFQANWLGATQHYREKLALSDIPICYKYLFCCLSIHFSYPLRTTLLKHARQNNKSPTASAQRLCF
jgi:hypothetical protein